MGTKKTVGSKRSAGEKAAVKKRSASSKPSNNASASCEQSSFTLKCGDDFSIRNAQDFHQQLNKALENKQSVDVDASQVTQTDTAGLQMLYAFAQKAKENGLDFKLKEVSDDFRATAELLGMSDCLDLPSS